MEFLTNPQAMMPFLYPILGSACLSLALVMGLTYYLWDRLPVIAFLALHFLLEAATMLLLALVTGQNPVLPIADFRIWVVWLRVVMLGNLLITLYWQVRRFREHNYFA